MINDSRFFDSRHFSNYMNKNRNTVNTAMIIHRLSKRSKKSRRTGTKKQYSTGSLKVDDDETKLKNLINYLTQIAMTQDSFSKLKSKTRLGDFIMIHPDGKKGIINNEASLNVVDYLNFIIEKSPVLDYSQIRTIKLPQIRDFKYRTKNK